VHLAHGLRLVLVTCAYLLVVGVVFVAKFVFYDRWVFAERTVV
jgi:hypothetical protein